MHQSGSFSSEALLYFWEPCLGWPIGAIAARKKSLLLLTVGVYLLRPDSGPKKENEKKFILNQQC